MAHWVTDMSPGFVIEGALLKHVQAPRETKPCNAMWQDIEDGVHAGQHFWNIHFPTLEGEVGVGLTSKDHFKPGYQCQAIQYLTGDLRNGGRNDLLVEEFGKKIRAGDTIGMLAVFEEQKLKLYFEQNGVSLGLAFMLTDKIFKSIFPIVTFYNSGSATCTKLSIIRDITFRPRPVFTGMEGDWKVTSLTANNVIYDSLRRITSEFRKLEPNKYTWNVQVKRTFQTTATLAKGQWTTTPITTKAAPVPAGDPINLDLEERIRTLILGLRIIEHDEIDDYLFIESENIATVWKRYDPTPGPFAGNPFDRS